MSLKNNRNFGILVSGQLVSTVGNNLFSIALPWYVYVLTSSKTALALTGLAQTVPGLFGLFAGVWTDRWSKRRTMITSDIIRAALCVILFLCVTEHAGLWYILVLVLGLQIVGQFFNPAASGMFPLLVLREDFAAAAGLMQSTNASAQLVGTLSGGALMAVLGAPLLFVLNGISFLASVISLFFIRVNDIAKGGSVVSTTDGRDSSGSARKSFRSEWLEGVKYVTRSKFLILVICAALVTNGALAPFDITLTAWVKGPMHGSALFLGLINGAFFVGVIAGGLVLGNIAKKLKLRAVMVTGLVGLGLCTAAIALFHTIVPEILITLVAGLATGSLNGSIEATFIGLIAPGMLGRVSGLIAGLATLATPLGMAIFGALMVRVPLAVVLLVIGALCALSGASLLLPVRDDKDKLLDTVAEVTAETL